MSNENSNPFVSMKTKTAAVNPDALRRAVSKQLGVPVQIESYQTTSLQGGTLGDVQLLSGDAQTANGCIQAFRIVLKTQKHWERPGDPGSWRREYDLFESAFHTLFKADFRCPQIYLAEENGDENRLWMAYIEGISGANLTLDNLTLAAEALGRFQTLCHAHTDTLNQISCLSDATYMQQDFAQWTPDTMEYKYLRSDACALPPHLQQMLIHTQTGSDVIFEAISRLPKVLCHRDYWTENIFVQDGCVTAIDWDCMGWGVIGEDIASLIADEIPAGLIGIYHQTLLPAYYSALAQSMKLPPIGAIPIREMILFKFGYRLLQQLMFSETQEEKAEAVRVLESIYALPPMQA